MQISAVSDSPKTPAASVVLNRPNPAAAGAIASNPTTSTGAAKKKYMYFWRCRATGK